MATTVVLGPEETWAAEGLDEPPINTHALVSSSLSEAHRLLEKKKWDEAVIAFRSILRANPGNASAVAGLVKGLIFSGRREEALGFLSAAHAKEKGTKRKFLTRRIRISSRLFLTQQTFQLYQDGINLLVARKQRAALERFRMALQKEPDNAEILTRLGQLQVDEGDFDTAAETLKQARRLNPFESVIGLWLGRAMHQRGELREALDQLKVAYVDLRGSELAPIWYADALVSLGKKELASQILEDHAKAHPLHLRVILAWAKIQIQSNSFRSQAGKAEAQKVWTVRKQLQLVLSRLSDYDANYRLDAGEGELSFPIKMDTAEVRAEAEKLLAQVEPLVTADEE